MTIKFVIACPQCNAELVIGKGAAPGIPCPLCATPMVMRRVDAVSALAPQPSSPPVSKLIESRIELTTALPPIGYTPPATIEEIMSTGGSFAGLSAVSSFLSCPEASRLRAAGVRRRKRELDLDFVDLSEDPLGFGSLMHALRATRLMYGLQNTLGYLWTLKIDEDSRLKANNIMRLYDQSYPLGSDPFEYLGIEVEVISDIRDASSTRSCIRSVRYDTVIRMKDDGAIFSFECKTAGRSGENQLSQYWPQAMSHTTLWNSSPEIVAKYGPMRGTIYDLWIKTEVPKCERIGPRYVSKLHQKLATDYLRLPEAVHLPISPDGSYPRFLHNCWGKFRPCEYISLCHDDARGDFDFPE